MDKNVLDVIKQIKGVTEVSPSADTAGQIVNKDISADVTVMLHHKAFLRLSGLRPIEGLLPKEENVRDILISKAALKLLGIKTPKEAIGKNVRLTFFIPEDTGSQEVQTVSPEKFYTIKGVTDEESVALVLARMDSTEVEFPYYSLVKVKTISSEYLESARNEILTLGFTVSMLSDTIDQANKIFHAIQIVLAVFGIIALIVSAIGMFNTMTVALLERTQEIGIMKAIGASNRDVFWLFLVESSVMGFLGGGFGVGIGYLAGELFNFGINILAGALGGESMSLFVRPTWFIMTIIMFSGFVGFLTGVFPARRAGKLNPLSSLRYK